MFKKLTQPSDKQPIWINVHEILFFRAATKNEVGESILLMSNGSAYSVDERAEQLAEMLYSPREL